MPCTVSTALLAGDFSRGVAAHAVGHDVEAQVVGREERVFVRHPSSTDVTQRRAGSAHPVSLEANESCPVRVGPITKAQQVRVDAQGPHSWLVHCADVSLPPRGPTPVSGSQDPSPGAHGGPSADVLRRRRERVFLVLSGLFLGTLSMLNILGVTRFIDLSFTIPGTEAIVPMPLAVGVLPYPVTFLCTDFISELYGRKRATEVVWMGLLLNVWVVAILWLGGALPSAAGDNDLFMQVRRLAFAAVIGSMVRIPGGPVRGCLPLSFLEETHPGKTPVASQQRLDAGESAGRHRGRDLCDLLGGRASDRGERAHCGAASGFHRRGLHLQGRRRPHRHLAVLRRCSSPLAVFGATYRA